MFSDGKKTKKNYLLAMFAEVQRPRLVKSWISANPGLKFNMLSGFVYFCMSAYFKTLENRTSVGPDRRHFHKN